MRSKQAIKLLHALVLAINKTTCRQDKRICHPIIPYNHGYMKQTTMCSI